MSTNFTQHDTFKNNILTQFFHPVAGVVLFCVACVALGDIQSAFACVANMAPAFLVARLGAVDVAAAAALTSTLLWLTVTTDVTHCVVRLASSCPLVWAPLSPPLAPPLGTI